MLLKDAIKANDIIKHLTEWMVEEKMIPIEKQGDVKGAIMLTINNYFRLKDDEIRSMSDYDPPK